MDTKWTKSVSPDDDEDIPPLPSRAQELAYLDKLESEFREQSYEDSGFPPGPTRRYQVECYHDSIRFQAQKGRKMLLTSFLISPFTLWLTGKSFTKKNVLGIPYRQYPMQHKVRFWSVFLAYELAFTWYIYYSTVDKDLLEKATWPLNTTSRRVL